MSVNGGLYNASREDWPPWFLDSYDDVFNKTDFELAGLLNGSAPGQLEGLGRLVHVLSLAGIPLVILVGLVGNGLALVVFICTHLRFQSSSVYLAFLNVADCGFLTCLFITWLPGVNVQLFNQNGWCQGVVYFSYVWAFLSPWTVVSFTVERYIVVFYPLRKHRLCTAGRAKCVLCCLAILSLLLYSFATWTTGLIDVGAGRSFCIAMPRFTSLVRTLTTMDSIVTLVIPSIVIVVLNISITVRICDFVHKRRAQSQAQTQLTYERDVLMKTNPESNQNESPQDPHPSAGTTATHQRRHFNLVFTTTSNSGQGRIHTCVRQTYQLRTTRALVIVSSVFVLLNLPSHAFRLYAFVVYSRDATYIFPRNTLLWQQLFQFLHYSNFAVNVFLYSACSRSFRSALKRLTQRCRHHLGHTVTKMTAPLEKRKVPEIAMGLRHHV